MENNENNESTQPKKEEPMMINGKEVKNIRIMCSKHGDISEGSIYLNYATILENNRKTVVNNNNLICMSCLNDYYMQAQKEPRTIVDISYKKDENGKLVLDENGDPIRIETKKIVYVRDNKGDLILDKKGNPVPELNLGTVSVDIEYKNPEGFVEGNKE